MSGGNEVELFPGDELQIDGGVLVVETVGSKNAEGVLKGGDGKLVEVRNPYPKHLVLSRGNKPEAKTSIKATEVDFPVRLLASANRSLFIERPRKPKAGMVRLEPGDQLCHGGEVRTVVEVTDKTATIENDAGQQFNEKRFVNEFLFTDCNTNEVRRLNAAQRAAHLKEFLATRKPPVAGDDKPSGEQETVMAKKAKVKKVKGGKKSKVGTNGSIRNGNPKLFGFSNPSVVRRLKVEGVETSTIRAIMCERKVVLSDSDIGAHPKFGTPAPMTKEQISELKALIPETK